MGPQTSPQTPNLDLFPDSSGFEMLCALFARGRLLCPEAISGLLLGCETTNAGYGTTNADAGVGIDMKRGIQKLD